MSTCASLQKYGVVGNADVMAFGLYIRGKNGQSISSSSKTAKTRLQSTNQVVSDLLLTIIHACNFENFEKSWERDEE